jgi:hypothetical protein
MPQNGETNQKLGFYRNQCCGKEIVVPAGNEFPDCPNHPGLTTIWKSVFNTARPIDIPRESDTRAERFAVGDEVTVVGVGRQGENKTGLIESIANSRWYDIRLSDGSLIKCFGFDLKLLPSQSAKSA